MHLSTVPINTATQVIQDSVQQLATLSALQLPQEALQAVRLLQLRRLARRIEAIIPGHFGHGERTAHYALLLAEQFGFTEDQRRDLHYAALLHDIGLLTLPEHLLDEGTTLGLADYALIQSHPREGAALLSPYPFLLEPARLIAHHHERWDGAGYPYGLRNEYIPLSARILAIADGFDSITSRSHSWSSALRRLSASAGSQFDPTLSAAFCDLLQSEDYRSSNNPHELKTGLGKTTAHIPTAPNGVKTTTARRATSLETT